MMKVYQPLCPDITFRLAADLSPDTFEESEISTPSSSSSSEDDELKPKLFQETFGSSHSTCHQNNRLSSSGSTSADINRNTKDIYSQEHIASHVTSSTSGPSGALSAPTPTSSASVLNGATYSCVGESDEIEKYHTEVLPEDLSPDIEGQSPRTCAARSIVESTQAARNAMVTARGIKRVAEDSSDLVLDFNIKQDERDSDADDGNDNDDNESVEDVSISHNVPMQPPQLLLSPSRSPAVTRRGTTVAEEMGAASGSSSDSENSTLKKSQSVHLDIQKPLSKYQGPYTLACDITPSPMQENVTFANTITVVGATANGDASAAMIPTTLVSNNNNTTNLKVPRKPRKLPEIPRKHQGLATASSSNVKSIFDEIQEVLIKEVSDEVFEASSSASDAPEAAQQYPFIRKHMGHLFDKKRLLIGYATRPPKSDRSRNASTSSMASEAGAASSFEEEVSIAQAHVRPAGFPSTVVASGQGRRRKNSDGDGSRRHSSTTMSTPYHDLEVTHRGMHRFIPRHADEVQIGIGDPIHVIREFDDLWCEGVNLRSGERGIFPAMYANDLKFLEDSDGDDEHWKFTMRFLGAVEVTSSSGDFALCQAINKVAQQGRIKTASLCTLEINQYGIRMIDKSKEGHESHKFSNFFALKNISFCGTHPSNNRYFAFITKHPREIRFACHVFHSDRSTHRARDALGNAFKRFYQEYMAFTHPTEDIWME